MSKNSQEAEKIALEWMEKSTEATAETWLNIFEKIGSEETKPFRDEYQKQHTGRGTLEENILVVELVFLVSTYGSSEIAEVLALISSAYPQIDLARALWVLEELQNNAWIYASEGRFEWVLWRNR